MCLQSIILARISTGSFSMRKTGPETPSRPDKSNWGSLQRCGTGRFLLGSRLFFINLPAISDQPDWRHVLACIAVETIYLFMKAHVNG